MSESVGASAASSGSSPAASTGTSVGSQQQGSQGQSQQAQGGAKGTQGTQAGAQGAGAATNKGQAPTAQQAAAQLKELAEDNLDAVVKIKVNGQVKQVTVRDALKLAEKGEGADQKFQRAAHIERQAQEMSKLAKDNPEAFLRKWGIDPDQYSQARLARMLEEQMMSPEQRRLKELEEENKRYKETETQRQAREKQEKEQTEFKAADQQYRNEVVEAWQSSGLPPHPSFGIEIAKEMLRANAQGMSLTAKQAASKVKQDWIANTGSILEQMDAEAIHGSLPKAVHEKLRGHYVKLVSGQSGQAGAKAQGSTSRPGQSPASGKPQNSEKKMLSEKEYREYFKKL